MCTSNGQPNVRETAGDNNGKPKEYSALYALQLRAFINAAEDVDADPDVIDDLLEGLGDVDEEEEEVQESDLDDDLDPESPALPAHEQHSAIEEHSDLGDLEVETEVIEQLKREADGAWSKEDIRKMMHHLKECGMSSFIREYVITQNIPIVKLLFAFGIFLCPELRNKQPQTMLYFLRVAMSKELHLREKLPQYNTISDAVSLIQASKRVVVLTGAGISVSCGIPDFRSHNGLYAMLKERGTYDLDDPQQMFDIHYFRENPAVFYSFASQIYPSNFTPSPCHRFIKAIEDRGKLLRNYTQNIDTLETLTGITRVLQCHGSFATATCIQCKRHIPGTEIEKDIMEHRVPFCTVCSEAKKTAEEARTAAFKKKAKKRGRKEWEEGTDEEEDAIPVGVMKPDITFFGEKLADDFEHALEDDRDKIDLLIVIGTSLKVSPVSQILSHLPHSVPQILINKTPVRHINPDIILLGNADDIIHHLCEQLSWELPPPVGKRLEISSLAKSTKRPSGEMMGKTEPVRVAKSHVWLFEGAEGGKWVRDIEERFLKVNVASESCATQGRVPNEGPEAKKIRTG
ncbi:DHS-like NAD/FAD-binding domain-containing protein [Suillus clintonianus]|uniref:DHS-like NAD/FAD-binding domain-containing protein n=1 Tax=Suillus clintonianus TaxID=1904413 RepID=UPI001B86F03B|nr:DHS-like NAD/FAD-binding domain-containing protein [Suillus clintonianus]KAG2125059.1 DHS-like NAD/FAD-binding domain-containing protein [Suillus clintonianus]